MVCRYGRLARWSILTALAIVVSTASLQAQGGIIRGVVRDQRGQPVDGARVVITFANSGRKYEVKTDSSGEYLQVGLSTGSYTVVADKDNLGSEEMEVSATSRRPMRADLVLGATAASRAADTEALSAELQILFDEGVAAGTAGRHEEAIAKFQEGAELIPICFDCYNNIGLAHVRLEQYEEAEAAYKRAVEIKPNDASGYTGLANVYNAQRKFDLAAEASAKANQYSAGAGAEGGGGNADSLYNQGVILWNGGKVAEAKQSFEATIQADPNYAEAHYQLGMVLVNEGNLQGAASEFETYLKLAPSGPNAATAEALVAQLKQ